MRAPSPELIEVLPWYHGARTVTLMLGSMREEVLRVEEAELRARWMIDHLGGAQARLIGRSFESRGETSVIRGGGRSVFLVVTRETALALGEVSIEGWMAVEELVEIACYGRMWAGACAGLRDTHSSPWRNQSSALTRLWPGLGEEEREIVCGLAGSWEGSATGLCEAARALAS